MHGYLYGMPGRDAPGDYADALLGMQATIQDLRAELEAERRRQEQEKSALAMHAEKLAAELERVRTGSLAAAIAGEGDGCPALIRLSPPRLERLPITASTYMLGRSAECDIRVIGPYTSRRHARLVTSPEGIRIEDLGSANGVVVNGVVVANTLLRHGDLIDLGGPCLLFVEH